MLPLHLSRTRYCRLALPFQLIQQLLHCGGSACSGSACSCGAAMSLLAAAAAAASTAAVAAAAALQLQLWISCGLGKLWGSRSCSKLSMVAITEALLYALGGKAAARPAALSLLIPDVSLATRPPCRPDEPMGIAQVAMVATSEAGTKKVGSQVFETPENFLLEGVGGVVLPKKRQQWGIAITCLDWWSKFKF